jgi:hypothetical protein
MERKTVMNGAGARSESNGKHLLCWKNGARQRKARTWLRQRDQDLDTKDEGRPNRSGAADQATPLSGGPKKKNQNSGREILVQALRARQEKNNE